MDWIRSIKTKLSTWLKGLLTQHSSKIVSLFVGVTVVWHILKEAVLFLYKITSLVIKKLFGESNNVLIGEKEE